MTEATWQFWIDRGGTFTDVIARRPDGVLLTHKLLSDNPEAYADAAIQGMCDLLGVETLTGAPIGSVKMGTTVGTNALLQRRGARTAWVTTKGFGDALRIGTQARPDLFALDIHLPEPLYSAIVEVDERVDKAGQVLLELDTAAARARLLELKNQGIEALAICLLHGYRHPVHERALAELASELGFAQVSVSHEVSPLMKFVPRGDTTVVDAYLSPVLGRYVERLQAALDQTRLLFMQSGGGLVEAQHFQGKDCLLSGPAGGVIGMVQTARAAGFDRLIGFDMGGTSTDVCHYAGHLERTRDGKIEGIPVRAPMMRVHTVAAGGGSILHWEQGRMRVGPDSAGAEPGPACYGQGGPLTVTDCQVALGTLRPEYFPAVLGPGRDQRLDRQATRARFTELLAEIDQPISIEALAEGFLTIAVDNMTHAIRRISVQRGFDVEPYTLVCFGGAGGQHACLVAERLGMRRIFLHPHAGVLSALGMGLARLSELQTAAFEARLDTVNPNALEAKFQELEGDCQRVLLSQHAPKPISLRREWRIRYAGSDTGLSLPYPNAAESAPENSALDLARKSFEEAHRARFGFVDPGRSLVLESITVEATGAQEPWGPSGQARPNPVAGLPTPVASHPVTLQGKMQVVPFYTRATLVPDQPLLGPAVVLEPTGTTVIHPNWVAWLRANGDLVLEYQGASKRLTAGDTACDPVRLELYYNRFMAIAEAMGAVLQNTAASVNIKERLDFSCAVFNARGELIANAPHIPVHLGSMGVSVRHLIEQGADLRPGDLYATNAPYSGGTHLPDITVIKPVFVEGQSKPAFFTACRGHHADIGGRVPGSAPADSTHIEEEGVLLDGLLLVREGRLLETELRARLGARPYPARNPDQNVADLRAQIAACETGAQGLLAATDEAGFAVVQAYMEHMLDYAEESVRRTLTRLRDAEFATRSDDGHEVRVALRVDRAGRSAELDFAGSSPPHPGNFNAPPAIASACVLYVFRCLLDENLPLNEGCLRPIAIQLPHPSWLSPESPSAVFAGNVETSQLIVDALLGALGVAAASQGTMNNVLWGNDQHQYYETVCGGAGATPNGAGQSAVQTHMTNSHLTDPEVLEWRYPVRVEAFSIRRGSGGAGQHAGGDGVLRRLRFLEAMHVNLVTGRRKEQPFGLAGGQPGQSGQNRILRKNGQVEQVPGVAHFHVEPGDGFEMETPGGGGFGTP